MSNIKSTSEPLKKKIPLVLDDPLMFSSLEADVLLGSSVNGILTPIT